MRAIVAMCISALLLCACGGAAGSGAQAHPEGWHAQMQGKTTAWIDPKDPQERYAIASNANASETLAEMGAKITVDTLLRDKGSKLLRAMPYPGCPGEAGLQTFKGGAAQRNEIFRIAYTQWNGTEVTAVYRRPASANDDPAAVDALTRAVCSGVSGSATLPPARG